jgi:hypothetical protein
MAKKTRRMTQSRASNRPKGSFPLPDGNYVVERTYIGTTGRQLRITAVRRGEPAVPTVARVLIDVAGNRLRQHDDSMRQ